MEINKLNDEEKEFFNLNENNFKSLDMEVSNKFIEKLYKQLKENDLGLDKYFYSVKTEKNYKVISLEDINQNEDFFLFNYYLRFNKEKEIISLAENDETLRNELYDLIHFYRFRDNLNSSNIGNLTENDLSYTLDLSNKNWNEYIELDNLDNDYKNKIEILILKNNKFESFDVIKDILKNLPNLKMIDLTNNPILNEVIYKKLSQTQSYPIPKIKIFIEDNFKNIQIFNNEFTKNCSQWGVLFSTFKGNMKLLKNLNINTLKYLDCSNYSLFNIENFNFLKDFKNLKTFIFNKTVFETSQDFINLFSLLENIKGVENIYFDDFNLKLFFELKNKIKKSNKNLNYLNEYFYDLDVPDDLGYQVNYIMDNIEKIINTFKNLDYKYYILDRTYSRISLNDEKQNILIKSLKLNFNNKWDEYFILFPLRSIQKGETIYDSYHKDKDGNELLNYFLKNIRKMNIKKFEFEFNNISANLFKNKENLLIIQDKNLVKLNQDEKKDFPIKLYTNNLDFIKNNFDSEKIELTNDIDKSNNLFLTENFIKSELNKNYINNFDLFSNRKVLNCLLSKFICLTFNIEKDLEIFLAEYFKRHYKREYNYWIIIDKNNKDKIITNNINKLLKLFENSKNYVVQLYNNHINVIDENKSIFKMYSLIKFRENNLEIKFYNQILYNNCKSKFNVDKRNLNDDGIHFLLENKLKNYENKEIFDQVKSIFKKVVFKNVYNELINGDNLILEIDFLIKKEVKYYPIIFNIKQNINYASIIEYDKNFLKFLIEDIYLNKNHSNFNNI